MKSLILVEHNTKHVLKSTNSVLAAALQLGDSVAALVVGDNCEDVALEVSQFSGINEVLVAQNEQYKYFFAENIALLIAKLADDYDAVLAPADTFGKDILPRVAALLDVDQVSDIIAINKDLCFDRPIYAGNAVETVQILEGKAIITVRTIAFDPISAKQDSCKITRIEDEPYKGGTQFLGEAPTQGERPDAINASIVVSGGRGLQSAQNFKNIIESLADLLGAGVGASRAAVDAGFAPNDYQIGQTGKVVAPLLYIAIGISGAVQHLAGMKDSKIIVAINQDPQAPIFQIATYGLVGDLFKLVPELTQALKNGSVVLC